MIGVVGVPVEDVFIKIAWLTIIVRVPASDVSIWYTDLQSRDGDKVHIMVTVRNRFNSKKA